jgi:serine/threonine protein kinase
MDQIQGLKRHRINRKNQYQDSRNVPNETVSIIILYIYPEIHLENALIDCGSSMPSKFSRQKILSRLKVYRSLFKKREILRGLSTWKHVHTLDFFRSFGVLSESKFGLFDLVLSFAEGGDLNQFLHLPRPPNWLFTGPGCFPFCKVLFLQTRGIADALKFLHDKTSAAGYIIHRGIKPANILIQNATFKTGDLGSSRIQEAEETSKTEWGFGTLMYAPPEKTIEDLDSYG